MTATMTNTHMVAMSGNTKTGPMPVTYRTADTCPTSCPFLPANQGGCYGSGRIFGIAAKYASELTVEKAASILARSPRGAKYLRDRVVGDVVANDGSFDITYVETIAGVARDAGLIPFGYTHHWGAMTADDVARTVTSGYVMNASCETADDITRAVSLGMPAVVTGDAWADGDVVAGRRIVTCPAQTRDDVDCSSCGLCAKPNRAATVRFLVHGPTKMAARAIDARTKSTEV